MVSRAFWSSGVKARRACWTGLPGWARTSPGAPFEVCVKARRALLDAVARLGEEVAGHVLRGLRDEEHADSLGADEAHGPGWLRGGPWRRRRRADAPRRRRTRVRTCRRRRPRDAEGVEPGREAAARPSCPTSAEREATLAFEVPGAEIPDRPPLMSARRTGTPCAQSCSAMSWSVLVLPVPVAPVTRPCRLSVGSGMRTCASDRQLPSHSRAPRSRAGPVKAYPAAIVAALGGRLTDSP